MQKTKLAKNNKTINKTINKPNNKTIKSNKLSNKPTKTQWSYLPLSIVNKLEKLAEYYNVSHKARGLQKPTKSDIGFLPLYRKYYNNIAVLEKLPVKSNNPDGEKWQHHRDDFCKRRYSMIKTKKNYGLYDENGLPTVMHTNMLMWACSPDRKNIVKNVDKILSILDNLKKQK